MIFFLNLLLFFFFRDRAHKPASKGVAEGGREEGRENPKRAPHTARGVSWEESNVGAPSQDCEIMT